MRRDGFLLPALGMALLYSSLYLGLMIINMRSTAGADGAPFVLFHILLTTLAGLGLYFAAKKPGRLRLCSIPSALLGLAFVGIPFLPCDQQMNIFNGRPPLIGPGMALFMPLALTLFFRAAPAGREGFSFGLVMACAELVWALFFPLLGDINVLGPENRQALHLLALNCWLLGGAGLCMAATLAFAAPRPDFPGHKPDRGFGPQAKRLVLLAILAASAGVFVLMGLHMGMFLPKMSMPPELVGLPHFLLILLLPLAGRVLDSLRPGRLLAWIIMAVLPIPLLGLVQAGLIGLMPLFSLLNVLQQVLLLTALTAIARLMQAHTALPLLLVLAYSLHSMHVCGVALRGRVEALPYGVFAASLLLVAGIALCLWRCRRLLADTPKLWELPQEEASSMPDPGLPLAPDPDRLTAFGTSYGLSRQEILVMEMLARLQPTKGIAEAMNVTENTVRTYVKRMLLKTQVPDRIALIALFAAHGPDPAEPGSPGSR